MTEPFQRVVHAMAMPFTVVVARDAGGPTDAELGAAVDLIHRDLKFADDTFSLWQEGSPLSRLARGEIEVDDCPPAVAEVLAECELYRTATGGAFDARRPDGVIDPTGIVKTWAVARAAWRLGTAGADDWMIGASGDVLAQGLAPGGEPWAMGIGDPRHDGDPQSGPILDVVLLGDEHRAMCTSGTAQHGEHIWNTAGQMSARYAQVSVVGLDIVECDAWATAVVAGGEETALAAQRAGLEVLCIDLGADGEPRAVASPGWPGQSS